ncbi:alpha/beta hydrolase family protein [Sulfolobus acidocaldarius]|uniref:Conserved Prokaryal protein n=4 Tax=Sulfolobus acidocaldarius TaxID=2285 RepID=Q4J892_SULAC|nr:S9 family peptidase [Sulfolobus acidocaldarius]AAY80989.1 conserved Prokaryal protein [Sulfolobus acidocaldarius DSM 639]AGE71590.1 hypothetical protein SacN8_08150 [Sulfolobus acidocaldarius N8]AGE73863.1 hypothetical protein SacRon12I_08160 [Sulfolobus acidocaldarius Ron12/I]ALU30186.1 acylaminoacyl-peptidase [Sulfolobus acidocaldarius]ALU30901.1 acylaminoacyl-peptidase [Sulfolobus acidocaldarius]
MQKPEEAYSIRVIPDVKIVNKGILHTENKIEGEEYRSYIFLNFERITNKGYEASPTIRDDTLYYVNTKRNSLVMQKEFGQPEELFKLGKISKYTFHDKGILVIGEDKTDKKSPFVASKLKYRFDSRGLLRSRLSLYLFSHGELRKVVSGDFDVTDVATNGKRIIISATKEGDDYGLGDLYEVDVETGELKRITKGEGTVVAVAMNEKGEVAYLGHREGKTPWSTAKVILPELGITYQCGKTCGNHVLSDLFDGVKDRLIFEGDVIVSPGQEGGEAHLYLLSDGKSQKMTDGKIVVRSFDYKEGKLVYTYSTPEKPVVLYYEGQTYDPNPDVKGLSPQRVEVNGIEGWAIISGENNPTILFIHGGPHTAYGYAYFIEFQYFARNGYNVIYSNPRGSQGYGEEFAKACVGDWGGKDMNDLLLFVEEVKRKYNLKGKIGVTGGSYGGFMTNWLVTQTNVFSAAISERGISNLVSMCGTSDIGFWFNAVESGVTDPWTEESQMKLMRMSPIYYVKNVKTPTMLIHGEEDYRCPIEQSEQFFIALKMNGVDTILVRYQQDSHEHARRGKPKNMRDRLERKLEWFDKYLKK